MQKNLVIVESPAKAKTIEKFLGKDYKVMSSYGHIRDLKPKEFSVDVEHAVQIYFEATPQMAVNTTGENVTFAREEKNNMTYLKTGTVKQPVLERTGDDVRIDWGYFFMAAGSQKGTDLQLGDYFAAKQSFVKGGKLPAGVKPDALSPNMEKKMSVLAYSRDLGNVTQPVSDYMMLGYDDVYSIQYFKENRMAYWKHNGQKTIYQAFEEANKEYNTVMKDCRKFDTQMMDEAEKSGGKQYAELCAIAYRQSVAAHKLVTDKEGNLLFFSKENFSNGSIGTVDVTYPSSPLYLLYNPDLLKGMLNPIFYFSESGKWKNPFAAHAPTNTYKGYISYLIRSKDLKKWQLSSLNPILKADEGEGINNSDVDLIEYKNKTYLYYATGDQMTWGTIRIALFNGSERKFFESYFPKSSSFSEISAIKQDKNGQK